MTRSKILYVDDEAMALKYFERLVGPIAPVLTAVSVDEGRALLDAHADEVAVLVCDQRMPGARGNELLRHARDHHPSVVRMLTTAYSDIGEAIEAINSGEIYRYISKPWTMEALRADLRNALDLAALRAERDSLLREKLMVTQGRLLGQRIGQLCTVAAALGTDQPEAAVHAFVRAALAAGIDAPSIDWHRWGHAELQRAEADRSVRLVAQVRAWWTAWGHPAEAWPGRLSALARALERGVEADSLRLPARGVLTAWFADAPGEALADRDAAVLAWLLWVGGAARLQIEADAAVVHPSEPRTPPDGWLADAIEAAEPPPG